MKHYRRYSIIMIAAILICFSVLLIASLPYQTSDQTAGNVEELTACRYRISSDAWQTGTLGLKLNNLPDRTHVTVEIETVPSEGDRLYIKDVYCPIKVYMDDELVYAYGQEGTYPSFLKDPPVSCFIIPFPETGKNVTVRLEYDTQIVRRTFSAYAPVKGNSEALMKWLFNHAGSSFIMAVLLTSVSIILIAFGLIAESSGLRDSLFFWLGMFALACGCWAFGENDMTRIYVHNPTLLYFLNFGGLCSGITCFSNYIQCAVDFHQKKFLQALTLFDGCSFILASLLQLTGLFQFTQSVFFFHAIMFFTIFYVTIRVIYETVHYRSRQAEYVLIPILIVEVGAVADALYYYLHISSSMSFFFQLCLFFFVLSNGIPIAFYMKEHKRLEQNQQEMQFTLNLMHHQIEEQTRYSQIVQQKEEQIRRQRHDLRHHLAAMRGMADSPELQNYIDSLINQIPARTAVFCENRAVNAILSHYDSICQDHGIQLKTNLTVPPASRNIPDKDLCIIFGNMVENAIEACERMAEGSEKWISLTSSIKGTMLIIEMVNTYNGKAVSEHGRFRSSKRDAYGIGLTSIKAVAESHMGDASFHPEKDVFRSRVYMRMEPAD